MEEQAYERRQVPKTINIHGYDLNYKDPPLKGKIFLISMQKRKPTYLKQERKARRPQKAPKMLKTPKAPETPKTQETPKVREMRKVPKA